MRSLKSLSLLAAFALCASSVQAASSKEVTRREVGNLVMENIPEIPGALKDRLNQYENIRSASALGWLPGEQGLVISTRFGEASQLHTVRGPLQYRKQITFFDEPVGAADVSPVTPHILFLKDKGGNENSQIYLLDLESGRSKMLTDGESRNESALWDHQGRLMAFASTKRNGRDTDVYIQDLSQQNAGAQLVVQEGGSWEPMEFSYDGNLLLVSRTISINENYLYLYDLKAKKLEQIFPGMKMAFGAAAFAKDSQNIFLSNDSQGEFKTLYVYNIGTKSAKPITANIKWDVDALRLSPDGKTLVFETNEGGISKLYSLDTRKLSYKELKGLPIGQIGNFTFHPQKNNLLAMTLSSARSSGDVFVYDLKSNKLQAWTESETGGLNKNNFVEPELISYPTFDEAGGQPRQIPAFIYKPRNAKGKIPVVISIHGGPEAQFRPGFSASFQYYATEMGVAVIAPNVRGSSGYGKTYLTLDNGFKREDSVKDIGALLDWIGAQADLDASKVVVMGGSYGGYMTLATMTYYSDRLAGGIDTVGISHFISFLTNTKSYRQDLRRVEYGDERDPDMKTFLDKISPLTNVKKIQKPLFVVQGLNDPRVPTSEAEQIVKAVRANGNEAWYLLAKDEGHGFRKKANQSVYLQTTVMFLEKVLFSPKAASNP
ncbi:MAG TPA: S9 family peptidase [Oligoflexus sp.]|uniref:S9 family peptidase n=1 Tax=Oligoflexus sp. TaxID=1971216 RepID=UPI002D807E54|nr:S9 family peptidase [Oligoflexus sp.]HET9241067.1 S9 family peptidase [Oligoflexus sp.]